MFTTPPPPPPSITLVAEAKPPGRLGAADAAARQVIALVTAYVERRGAGRLCDAGCRAAVRGLKAKLGEIAANLEGATDHADLLAERLL